MVNSISQPPRLLESEMPTTYPDLLETARAAADSVLAEHGGTATLRSLLTLAYLRGNSDGHAEATRAAVRVVESTREKAA